MALILSIAITSVFYVRVSRQQAAMRPKIKKILGAAADIPPGIPVAAESLTEIDWPENVPVSGTITNRDDIVGHTLTYPVAKGEPVLQKDLASSGSMGLAAKIPDGMRAVAVRTNDLTNMAGFIFPGSRVDVLLTLRTDNNALPITRTVLQNVEVLSAGTRIQPDPQGKPENVAVVTVLVTPQDSQLLTLAQQQGTIQFSLRNSGDAKVVATSSADVPMLAGAPPKPPEQARTSRPVVRTKSNPAYIVETIAGNKSSVSKFEATQ